jgi:ERCC4-related helicase
MEEKYSHNKDVMTFVRTTRERLSKLKATTQSPYHTNIKNKLESLTTTFMKTAKDDSSYDGENDFPEINMTTEARMKGWQIASTIVEEGLKKNLSFTQIAEQLDKALTRENLGLIYKSEKPEEVLTPTYKNLGEFNDSHKWLRGDIKNPQPNDLNELNKAIKNKQPMFPKHTINTQVRNILTSIKTDPTNPKIDKRIRLLLKASGKPLSEFFIEQLTKNGETVSPELIEVLEALDKVKL